MVSVIEAIEARTRALNPPTHDAEQGEAPSCPAWQ